MAAVGMGRVGTEAAVIELKAASEDAPPDAAAVAVAPPLAFELAPETVCVTTTVRVPETEVERTTEEDGLEELVSALNQRSASVRGAM